MFGTDALYCTVCIDEHGLDMWNNNVFLFVCF